MTETKQVTDFLENLYQGPTKREQSFEDSLTPQKMKLLEAIMEEAIDCGLLSDKGKIRKWCNRLTDKTERELAEGIRKIKDLPPDQSLSLNRLRALCTYIAPLEERIAKDRQLAHQKSDPETIEMYKRQRKQTHGI